VLESRYAHYFNPSAWLEKSVIVFGAMEAALTPLMQSLEQQYPQIKVFSLPSVDHPEWGRHIELGVKGEATEVALAYPALLQGLALTKAQLGPELVRN
jgi:molybdopterin-biosynthesis enzyme MoeA-like protein